MKKNYKGPYRRSVLQDAQRPAQIWTVHQAVEEVFIHMIL